MEASCRDYVRTKPGKDISQQNENDMEASSFRIGSHQRSCSLWLHKLLPVDYVIRNPKVSLISYLLVQVVVWAHLSRFELHPTDSVLAIKSPAQETANSIVRIFGPNEDPFSLHRSTDLGMWLEVIIKPWNASLLSEAAINEVHQLDRMLKTMNVSFKTVGVSKAVMATQTHGPNKTQPNSFQLREVCAKQTASLCSIDGSFILQKEFLRDVVDEDLQLSVTGFYSYPRRGLPSYGPYMFGNKLSLSKHGMIQDVNALRFRYNLRGNAVGKQTMSALQSAHWEEAASELINNYHPRCIHVLYATSTQLKRAVVSQSKQGLPFIAAATLAYFVTLSIALTKLTTSSRKYIFSVAGVLLNVTTLLTTFGILTLFHYKPTAPSIMSAIAIIVIGTHQFTILLARFDDIYCRQYVADNRLLSIVAFQSVFRQFANNIFVIFVFTSVVGFTTNIKDIQSSCLVVAIGSIVIAVNCLFAYLPLCNVGYRVETLQLSRYKASYCGYGNHGRAHDQCSARHFLQGCNRETVAGARTVVKSNRKKRLEKISMYVGIFTLAVFVGLLLGSLICARNKLKKCGDEPTGNRSTCGLVYAQIFRQSNLLLPSLRTRRILAGRENTQENKPLSLGTASYIFLKSSESDFTAGAPIQVVYESAEPGKNVCPTLEACRALVSQCKQMPDTDRNFEIAWYKVFRSPARRKDLSTSLFAKDIVFLEEAAANANQSANGLAMPCSFVRDYRVYCSFKAMKMTMAAIRTMRALAEMAQNATLSVQQSGRFGTFSLLFLLLELVDGTYKSMMIAASVYLAAALIPCLVHELFNIVQNRCRCHKAEDNTSALSNRRRQNVHQLDLRRLWNAAIYILETVDIFLLSYVYICLADIPIDFVNAGLVVIGFLLMPLCLNGNLLIEVVEDNRPVLLNPVENEIEGLAAKDEATSLRTGRSFKARCGRGCKVNSSMDSRESYFVPRRHDVIYPLIVNTVPLVWFAFMLPFTDSPLLRTLEHVCLYTCIRGVFASSFVYISLKGFLNRN